MKHLIAFALIHVFSLFAHAQLGPFGVWNKAGSSSGGGGSDPCTGSPSIGTQCTDGTYYVGTITISGSTYKLATTPSGCGYESGGSASTVPTSLFTPTCSGADTMIKNSAAMTPVSGTDQTTSVTSKSTVPGSTSTDLIVAAYPDSKPAYNYCKYLNFGGKTDWFLPNRSELHLMACHGTTSANGMPGTQNDDANCATNGYGSGANVVPNFKSGNGNPAGYIVYHTSSTATWGGSGNFVEQTSNWAYSGDETYGAAGTGYLVRCMRVIP